MSLCHVITSSFYHTIVLVGPMFRFAGCQLLASYCIRACAKSTRLHEEHMLDKISLVKLSQTEVVFCLELNLPRGRRLEP